MVSIWEIAIKTSLRKSDFNVDAGEFRAGLLDQGLLEIDITGAYAVAVAHLPLLHRDPFDRLLLAQARLERLPLMTADKSMAAYGEGVLTVG